jgi:hypothetical protein
LNDIAKRNAQKKFYCGVENNAVELKLEQEVIGHEYRSLDIRFDYFRKLVKPEVNVVNRGRN